MDEWITLHKLAKTIALVGFAAITASIINLLLWKECNKQYLFLLNSLFS
jgi:hypothetical protein